MLPAEASLSELTAAAGLSSTRFIADRAVRIALKDLATEGGDVSIDLEACRDRSVFIMTAQQLPAVSAAMALDGVARRIVLCPPGLDPSHIGAALAEAEADLLVLDAAAAVPQGIPGNIEIARCGSVGRSTASALRRDIGSEWLLFTSGTTGRPKMVVHSLRSLAGPPAYQAATAPAIWSTFYDVRRYGGMQILLRALLGGGSMVLSDPREPVREFLRRAGLAGVSHISGTPSHWRRALMSPDIGNLSPQYIRLSGEVADQAVLNQLKQAFPTARIVHAFASTEAGVAFDVDDGLAGFPSSLLERDGAAVEMRVRDGSLHIRSSRIAARYAHAPAALADAEGFVDTNDMVERRGDRHYFTGRREGIINVGGQKVHPEEVEAVVNLHPAIRMSRVRARSSGITGALVVADVVVGMDAQGEVLPFALLRNEVLNTCRRLLPAHKVPAVLYQVEALGVTAAGKLQRVLA